MSRIKKAYRYDKLTGKFIKEYTLSQFHDLETKPENSEEFNAAKGNLFCAKKLINGVPDEDYRIYYHGKSKVEFHHARNTKHFFMCDEFDGGHEETVEHKFVKDIIYDIATNEGGFKVIVEGKKYELDIESAMKEEYVELSVYIFKPDIVLKLKNNEKNKVFIEKYCDCIYLEICNTHSNSNQKIDAFRFENLFLVELNVKEKYYVKHERDEQAYYIRIKNQLMNNYVTVTIHSNFMKDIFEDEIVDDNGIKYHLWREHSEKKYYVKWYEYGKKCQEDKYRGRLFTKKTAKLYMLYKVRLSRSKLKE
ncbi:MAG: hypothetical protein K6F81_01875 [Acholeplasmatales bacterium]|nr:hypothetical protein [Acholeplasmatales bacterium]